MGAQQITPDDIRSPSRIFSLCTSTGRSHQVLGHMRRNLECSSFRRFSQILPDQVATTVQSPNLWLRSLSGSVVVHAFSAGGTSSLMADVEFPPEAKLEVGQFPSLVRLLECDRRRVLSILQCITH